MNSRALGMSKDKKSPPTTWVEFHLGSQNHFFVWRNKTDRPTIKSQVSPRCPRGYVAVQRRKRDTKRKETRSETPLNWTEPPWKCL